MLLCAGLLSVGLVTAADNGNTPETKSFTVKKGGMLRVNLNGGDIRLTPWDKDLLEVRVRGTGEDDENSVDIRQRENTITIQTDEEEGWSGDTRLDISLPSQFDLDLRTVQGDIVIDGAMSGKINGSTSAGNIRMGNVTGVVEMHTSGGDIHAGDVKGDLTLKTSGGDIVSGAVTGEADITTSGGNIRLKDVGKSLWAKTAGGDIDAGSIGGEATISTAGGNIMVGKVGSRASLSTAGGDVELQGATGRIRAKTAGGNLRLYGLNGSVDGETAGGDIDAELTPDGSGSSRLRTAGGNVSLDVPEKAKATIDATIRIQGRWRDAKDEYKIRSVFKSDNYVVDSDEHEIRATYKLNGGGAQISLETVNANIDIGTLGSRARRSPGE